MWFHRSQHSRCFFIALCDSNEFQQCLNVHQFRSVAIAQTKMANRLNMSQPHGSLWNLTLCRYDQAAKQALRDTLLNVYILFVRCKIETRFAGGTGMGISNGLRRQLVEKGQLYVISAVILLNTLISFIILNLLLQVIFIAKDAYDSGKKKESSLEYSSEPFNPDGSPVDNGKRNSYQLGWIDLHAYEGLSPSYVSEVLDDSYELAERGMAYQPWVEFAEPEFHGKLVAVERDELGFLNRRTINPPNPEQWPTVKIVTMGGSTTFGYNVSDEHTWPTYLSTILNQQARAKSLELHIEVVNYGRGYYYPSQETVLLIDLLKAGHRPQVAIFLDGVNSAGTNDVPEFYPRLKEQFHNIQFAKKAKEQTSFIESLKWIPVVRLTDSLKARLLRQQPLTVAKRQSAIDLNELRYKINTFRQNRAISKKICEIYSVRPMFVLQPHAVHSYNTALYRKPMPAEFFEWRAKSKEFYAAMRQDADLIYLGDLFEKWGNNKKAIIDELHYSPSFHQFLAEKIAEKIDVNDLNPNRSPLDKTAATGSRIEP